MPLEFRISMDLEAPFRRVLLEGWSIKNAIKYQEVKATPQDC